MQHIRAYVHWFSRVLDRDEHVLSEVKENNNAQGNIMDKHFCLRPCVAIRAIAQLRVPFIRYRTLHISQIYFADGRKLLVSVLFSSLRSD